MTSNSKGKLHMGNQLRLVAAFDAVDKHISRTIVYSVIAVIGFIGCNISVSRAQTVDPGFVPCDIGVINYPAICTRAATVLLRAGGGGPGLLLLPERGPVPRRARAIMFTIQLTYI